MIHALKILPEHFVSVIEGKKQFEVRKLDRPFQEGDLLALNEWDAEMERYTGRSCLVYIDYTLNDEAYCKEGYGVLGIKPCKVVKFNQYPQYDFPKGISTYEIPLATDADECYGRLRAEMEKGK